MSENKKISDLEHELIYKEIAQIQFKMHEGFSSIEKNLSANFQVLRAESKSTTAIRELQLDEILVEAKKTNGRVKGLESVTGVLKIMQENKWLTGLVLYAVYNILDISTLDNVIKVYKMLKILL